MRSGDCAYEMPTAPPTVLKSAMKKKKEGPVDRYRVSAAADKQFVIYQLCCRSAVATTPTVGFKEKSLQASIEVLRDYSADTINLKWNGPIEHA